MTLQSRGRHAAGTRQAHGRHAAGTQQVHSKHTAIKHLEYGRGSSAVRKLYSFTNTDIYCLVFIIVTFILQLFPTVYRILSIEK